MSRYQKGKTNLDFTEARDSEWQWYKLGHMQVCTSLQTDNHASTPPHGRTQLNCMLQYETLDFVSFSLCYNISDIFVPSGVVYVALAACESNLVSTGDSESAR